MHRLPRRLLVITCLTGATLLGAPALAIAAPTPPGPAPAPTPAPRPFQWIKDVQVTPTYILPSPGNPCCGIHATFSVNLAVDQALLRARKVTNGQPGPWQSAWALPPGPTTSFDVQLTGLFSGTYEVEISAPKPWGGWVTYTKPELVSVQIGGWPGE